VRTWVGFDVGKAFHWLSVLDDEGEIVLSKRVRATEEDLDACMEEIGTLGEQGERKVAIDLLGGPATMLEAVLLSRGERVFFLSGMAVNRARDGYPGEAKSDRGDARVIADQLRMRWRSLRELRPTDDATAELRASVSYRRDLVDEQARNITRLRALLMEVFPGLEAALDLRQERALLVLTKVATPTAVRRLGATRLARWLKVRGARKSQELAEIVRSLPGMGTIFTAEFLAEVGDAGRFLSADSLAAAAGLVPVRRESGKSGFQRRAKRGNRVLKRLLYWSAFRCAVTHPPSRAFYLRKRSEGKSHLQAVIALARRRVNVLYAMLRDGELYRQPAPEAA
jgi:transposase